MQRYFVDQECWNNDTLYVSGEDTHHIVRVMRMREGDNLVAIHPEKGPALCEITKVAQDDVHCIVVKWMEEDRELPVHVTIVASLGKGDKLEQIVQKGTELGASAFIPYQAARSVAKWDNKKAVKKIERLQKISKEASEQSERTVVPEVQSVHSLQQLLEIKTHYDHCFFGYADEARHQKSELLSEAFKPLKRGETVLVAFGPEGGFSESEVEKLSNEGFKSIRLGPRILRMETAPLYFLSSLSYMLEEF
ncbi:16S rRNA (uracil(1498)-N(3))-methyltransferase [Halobacillus sp. Nhm2S1]|uniref:16S rRNA (uracil(1498)-N(3))-methyltransferase n=1 Tax=Halobacillus sp. Nhm2S1 TaxID=2866716 RepID=UPI001C72DACE|nr:16S rRNA (uracil(1498)-N(3))-methyltransferase [Halobacillus sp. Nhm2S1]MBX0358769.1 16S rRNA (uracil(1498)-N(3))-methyltransferase [Halobacillus sp. Nhm2S1]